MRKRNWSEYNKHLVKQGSISFLIDPKVFRNMKKMKASKKRGRPLLYSLELIRMLFLIKIRFRLPYRALEGFAKDLFRNPGFLIPTYSLICKRVGDLDLTLPRINQSEPIVVVLDGSGMKVYGEGEWKVKIHGKGRPRKWVKVHIALNPETQEVLSECTTEAYVADCKMTGELLDKIPTKIRAVVADGGYDKECARRAIRQRKAKELIPPPTNAKYRYSGSDRDEAIAIIRGLGGDREARSIWGKLTGYNQRVLVESAFSRSKRLFGANLFSKAFDKQRLENTARWMLLNQMRRI